VSAFVAGAHRVVSLLTWVEITGEVFGLNRVSPMERYHLPNNVSHILLPIDQCSFIPTIKFPPPFPELFPLEFPTLLLATVYQRKLVLQARNQGTSLHHQQIPKVKSHPSVHPKSIILPEHYANCDWIVGLVQVNAPLNKILIPRSLRLVEKALIIVQIKVEGAEAEH
jgi:hypothetical protein